MNEHEKKPYEAEPTETGSVGGQKFVSAETRPELPSVDKETDGIQGTPIAESIANLPQAFRSHPAWVLLGSWVNNIEKDSGRAKKELGQVRDQLKDREDKLKGEEIKSSVLEERLSGIRQSGNLKMLVNTVGGILLALAVAIFDRENPFPGGILLIVSIALLLGGWALGSIKEK